LEKTLLRAGFDVDTAADVNQGLDLFKDAETNQTPFDMAVLDINMPGFDGIERSGAGLELLSKIKDIRQDVHIIMLTAYDEVNKAKDAVTRGARAYFVKGREQGLVELINETFEL
jgi:two-component system nitrogen regulation response regulator GlnG